MAIRRPAGVRSRSRISHTGCRSICSKSGYLHLVVSAERFTLLSGREALTSYTFNTGVAKHLFCSVCGVKSFYVPRSHPDGFSVNARCLDPGTVEDMTITRTEGLTVVSIASSVPRSPTA